ncbi:MAG: hypothetical protein RLY58_1961 [Pseudomonadota bacterium]
MRFQLNVLASLITLSLAGCGGSSDNTVGDTSITSGAITTDYMVACVDRNQNWQCDDLDPTVVSHVTGSQALTAEAGRYVLLESRSAQHNRTRLLISALGQNVVTGHTTLKTALGSTWDSRLTALSDTALAQGLSAALANNPIALDAILQYSKAVLAQNTAAPVDLTSSTTTLSTQTELATWQGTDDATESRQISTAGSITLSNNNSNRIYLFDAATALSADTVEASQIDLIPAVDVVPVSSTTVIAADQATPLSARLAKAWDGLDLAHQLERGLDQVLASVLMIDTVSAASVVTGGTTVTPPSNVTSGMGVAGLQLVQGGKEAVVLFNTASALYQGTTCAPTGSEGLFRISVDPQQSTDTYRMLGQTPACVHSGFSLMAASPDGENVVAWDSKAKQLWSINGHVMQAREHIDPHVTTPQALTLSASGRYAALAGYQQLAIIDLSTGQTLANLKGDWDNATHVSFAAGIRKILVTSGTDVHTITLDNALQFANKSKTTFANTLQGLSVSSDGDSYAVSDNKTVTWHSVQGNKTLSTATLPVGLTVKQVSMADNTLLVMGQGAQDLQYHLYRMTLTGLPRLVTTTE